MVTTFAQFFDNRGAFDFHIRNFSDLSGNIPTAPAYGIHISQLIRYSQLLIVMSVSLLDIPYLQLDYSTKDFLQEN